MGFQGVTEERNATTIVKNILSNLDHLIFLKIDGVVHGD